MRHNHKIILTFALGAAMLAGAASMTGQSQAPGQKLRMAEVAITQLYVDSVDENKLVEDAIRGMLEKLDPHSSYSTPDETRELNEPLEGNFSGVGITYNMVQDTLYVISTVSGGPAQKVGVLEGDRIIEVDDTIIAGKQMSTRDIQKRLRGPKGTDVDVKVLRRAGGEKTDTVFFTITRDDIPIYSVDAAYMVDGKTGYIRLNKFAAETPKEVNDAIKKLKKQGMTQLILDLTDNTGGYLNAATDMLGEFLEPGSLTVYTEGLNSPRRDILADPAKGNPLFADGRLVVMTNQYSASASEITSGAIQDWDRGLIVGRRSFGKGLVQRPLPFPDGSMIRLTVAHYYTPTGRDIQKPYKKGDQKSYAHDIMDRLDRGELMHADSVKYVDSLRVNTLKLKRPIYGGGGISPDLFVPLDTTANTKYYRNVTAKGIINRYVVEYVDAHRKALHKEYKNDEQFVRDFQVTDAMLDRLVEMANADKVEFNQEEFDAAKPLFKMIIKGLIGRDVFDNATYFKVYNTWDPIFKESLRLINSPDYDKLLSAPSGK